MRTARPMWSTISSAISCIIALLHDCIIVYEREAQMNQVSQWAMLRTI